MKKNAFLFALLSTMAVSLALIPNHGVVKADAGTVINGDLSGGVKLDFTTVADKTTDNSITVEINVNNGNGDYSGSGLYMRMRNLTAINTYITFKMNSTNTAIFGPATGTIQTYYDSEGNDITASYSSVEKRGWGNYLALPANFDGFVYFDYSTFAHITGDSNFDPAHIWRIYMDIARAYDSYAQFEIGDIFTDTKSVLDVSEMEDSDVNQLFVKQDSTMTITRLEKSPDDSFEIAGDLFGGAKLDYTTVADKTTDNSITVEINVNNGNGDYSGSGLYMRMRNLTAINTYITFKMNSTNTAIFGPATGTIQTYYDSEGNDITTSYSSVEKRGWGNYLALPANFDGFVYFDYSTFAHITGDSNFDPAHIWRIYMDIARAYDSYAQFEIGDMFTNTRKVVDTSEISDADFANIFVKQDATMTITRLEKDKGDDFVPVGDLLGGAIYTNTVYGGGMTLLKGANFSGDGVFIRLKNNKNVYAYILFQVSDLGSHRYWTSGAGGNPVTFYAADGKTKTDAVINQYGYVDVTPDFDGFIYLPWESLVRRGDDWAKPSEEFNKGEIYALHYEGDNINIVVGDIFTKDVFGYDGSTVSQADFPSICKFDHGDATATTITQAEGWYVPPVPEFDYSELEFKGGVEGGATVVTWKDENTQMSDFPEFTLTFPITIDLSDALALTMNIKALSGSFPFSFVLVDEDNNSIQLPKTDASKIKYVANGVQVNCSKGGNDHTIFYPNSADGTLVFPIEALEKKDEDIDLTKIKYIKSTVAVFWDQPFNCVFGDIGVVYTSTEKQEIVLKCEEIGNFASVYSVSGNYMSVSKYSSSNPCDRIGDTKILNTFDYASDEELHSKVTWNEGDNLCSYSVMDDGMKVHIGPFEAGHTYGSYMALKISNDRGKTDYNFYDEDASGNKTFAKGLQVYVKNLSQKEIGINLQFDDKNGSNYERWIMKGYPAMYYAYDVVKDVEYTLFCKSDQFQIPVGFEGYIRLPFDQFEVPDWCLPQSDGILNLEGFNGEFYLTSDNTRFEDLEFFMKNIGVYFNETKAATLFDSTNSIKSNLGLVA